MTEWLSKEHDHHWLQANTQLTYMGWLHHATVFALANVLSDTVATSYCPVTAATAESCAAAPWPCASAIICSSWASSTWPSVVLPLMIQVGKAFTPAASHASAIFTPCSSASSAGQQTLQPPSQASTPAAADASALLPMFGPLDNMRNPSRYSAGEQTCKTYT